MKTKVIHIKDAPRGWETNPEYVYIGRPGKGLDGPWGNPIRLNRDTPEERERVLREYHDWFTRQPHLMQMVHTLAGKTLVCFCHPKRCHGDVLAYFAEVI